MLKRTQIVLNMYNIMCSDDCLTERDKGNRKSNKSLVKNRAAKRLVGQASNTNTTSIPVTGFDFVPRNDSERKSGFDPCLDSFICTESGRIDTSLVDITK